MNVYDEEEKKRKIIIQRQRHILNPLVERRPKHSKRAQEKENEKENILSKRRIGAKRLVVSGIDIQVVALAKNENSPHKFKFIGNSYQSGRTHIFQRLI